MKDISDHQTISSLDGEQLLNVALGLMNAAGATLHRTGVGTLVLDCEDGERSLIDEPTTTVDFLFTFAMQHTA